MYYFKNTFRIIYSFLSRRLIVLESFRESPTEQMVFSVILAYSTLNELLILKKKNHLTWNITTRLVSKVLQKKLRKL